METKRNCRYVPLSKQPLVLVLCQVRFSPVRKMADYVPVIQEEFRRNDFPIERSGKLQQVRIATTGVQVSEQERWEYRTRDEGWSVMVLQDSVVLQTTRYERFEGFAEYLARALRTVLVSTEQDQFGVIERVGLRYVNLVQPRPGEDYRTYLRPGFHGVADEVFRPRSHRIFVQSVGQTTVGDSEGTMVVRVMQADQGEDLPADLVQGAPKYAVRAKPGEIVTFIDTDHYVQGTFDPNVDWVVARMFEMHDHIIETFHRHVVTEEAIDVWR